MWKKQNNVTINNNKLVEMFLEVINRRELTLNTSTVSMMTEYQKLYQTYFHQAVDINEIIRDINDQIKKVFNNYYLETELKYLKNFLGSYLMWRLLKQKLSALRLKIKKNIK
ncbi:hypothetical protein [Spiroplasma eriocheiris]|uniref:Uncharacterized protein n=1 Tax=Spiroplasma eriocheiris TaxID=315358 RepID=A0A0H3XH68_9MOLU|nr:hypothetical protein [Spiroplasma eriocheiris]AHF57494.1 hypothetical protein SPE_0365 [Spiroplasma eriocheiris CCTCC M 207170]AKM53953.1 hypothetical protein SERIO_v1c03710 [Spiroplasma eriocheiris]